MRSKEKFSASKKRDRETGRAALLAGEDGSVVVLALIILMLLTMVGTSATNTSTLELQVSANERHYKQNFFRTESAAMYGAQRIQEAPTRNQTFINDDTDGSWSHDASPSTNFDTLGNWTDLVNDPLVSAGPEYANTYNLVVFRGIVPWGDLDENAPTQLWSFGVYGQFLNNAKNERMIIETGFAKRM